MQSNNVQLLKGLDARGLAPLISFYRARRIKDPDGNKAYSDARHSTPCWHSHSETVITTGKTKDFVINALPAVIALAHFCHAHVCAFFFSFSLQFRYAHLLDFPGR